MNDRERLIRVIMREHVSHESWEGDLCDEVPGDHQRWLLIEKNLGSGSASQPVYLSTHESPEHARVYHDGQEYREDWSPELLVDLDNDTMYKIATSIVFEYDPPITPQVIHGVPHLEIPEVRPCVACGHRIQPGQLYIAKAPFHIGCAPKEER